MSPRAFGEATPHLEERIRRLRAQGWTQMQIAVEVGLAQGTVSVILQRLGLDGYIKLTQPAERAKRVRGKRA